MPLLSSHKNVQDAQWSPKPRKFCFCAIAAARPLCLPWRTKAAVMTQQVTQRRQNGGRTIAKLIQGLLWSTNGSTVVATVIAQWIDSIGRPKEAQCPYNESRSVAQIDSQFYQQCAFLQGDQWPIPVHPFCDHDDAFVFPPGSFERALRDRPPRRLLCDCFEHTQNFAVPMASTAMFNVLCTTLERPRQPLGLFSAFNGVLVSFVVAQWKYNGRSPCVKWAEPWQEECIFRNRIGIYSIFSVYLEILIASYTLAFPIF